MAEMDTRIKALEKLVNNMEVKTESTEELIEDKIAFILSSNIC